MPRHPFAIRPAGHQNHAPLTHITRAIASQGRRMDWLAARVGVSQGHLTHVLAGRRRLQEEHARRIADALGLPLDYVLQRPVEMPA